MVYNDQKLHCGKKGAPWYANYALITLDIVLLGWIQRMVFNYKTKVVEYKLVKYMNF